MKKWTLLLILFLLIAVIALGAFFLIKFLSSPVGERLDGKEVEAYAAIHWSQYQPSFNEKTQTLYLTKTTLLSYDDACKIGGNIYADSTAPETYLEAVAMIRADLISQFDSTEIKVVLSFLSTDGKAIFTVPSNGAVEACWR